MDQPKKNREGLEVSIYEWPDRFHVEAEGQDRDYKYFYPHINEDPPPHFVDLSEPFCSCRDFSKNILPNLVNENPKDKHELCRHIKLALQYRGKLTQIPKRLPPLKL
jgi:hypothetical protein